MDIIYKTGSILEASEPYIIHGCNAQGKMGSGVAKVLMDEYPDVKKRYLAAHARATEQGERFLGTLHIGVETQNYTVFNAITQEFYGYDGRKYVSYGAIELCMSELDKAMRTIEAKTGKMPHVAMPLIGCGLAGGDWSVVSHIIERCSQHFQPVVYTLDGVIPGV